MNDLISREKLIDYLYENNVRADISIEDLADEIFAKPKVGRWIDTNMTCCGAKVYKCSVCDNEIDEMPTEEGEPIWNYCPNCGAKMERRADGNKRRSV